MAQDTTVSETDETVFYLTEETHASTSTMFGFWVYLMSDTLIFAILFATFGVVGSRYAGGPTASEVLELPLVAVNTAMLLLSSITCGFAMLEMEKEKVGRTLFWLAVTAAFGAVFVGLELHEFFGLVADGAPPQRSAFLSSFFTLVGTHGTHVTVGIVWVLTLIVQVAMHGVTAANKRRLMCFSLFWHFLDIIWIGVFSFVYLLGSLQ